MMPLFDVGNRVMFSAALWDLLNAKRGFPFGGNWWAWRCKFRLTTEEIPCH